MDASPRPSAAFLIALGLISACSLAYEILLMRLFSIIEWHHFAYMMISLALLGYGASGTFLTLSGGALKRRFPAAFTLNALLFGLSALGCFLAAQAVPFNALETLWDWREWLHLLYIYLLLLLPFFFAANCVCLSLQHYKDSVGRIYSVDLIGAGAGAFGIIAALEIMFPLQALQAVAAVAMLATALAWSALALHRRWLVLPAAAAAPAMLVVLPLLGLTLQPVPYKGLSQALQVMGAKRLDAYSSPLGLLTVVDSPKVPFRYVPGLSLATQAEPPAQLGVFTDGDSLSVINRYRGERRELAFLDYVPWALPYHLVRPAPQVLVLGAGGGSDVLQALYHRAGRVDAVELNGQMAKLVSRVYAGYAGHVYEQPGVHLHVAEARGFVAADPRRYDVIQLALLDAFNTSSAGLYALNESYVYTVEALAEYLRHLRHGGFLSISRWVRLPPRDGPRLFATAVAALRELGVTDPGSRLLWLRSWQVSTLLVKNGAVTPEDIARLREFCRKRSFDAAYYPGMSAAEANRYNRLGEPYFYEAAHALLGPSAQDFMRRYKFDITPPTDDRPYFFQFFRWGLLPEVLRLRGAGGLSLVDLGYLVLVATLVQAAVVSVLLVAVPLVFARRRGSGAQPGRLRTLVYFFAIGLAFMFIEMAYIQKFILYLAHPLYAVAVVLTGFLIFAGIGSAAGTRRAGQHPRRRVLLAVAAIALISGAYMAGLPAIFGLSAAAADPLKIALTLGLIAPIAFCMGVPFPVGMSRLATDPQREALVPWAWAVNGCASVLAAILATLLAIHFGVTAVLVTALLFYMLAVLSLP